jgi:RNA polymerase sigma factor (sigma-70 family)
MNSVLQFLRRAVAPADGGNATDGQLLDAFITRCDGLAFAALVRRHGSMVLGVCRRVLGNLHDAEDAFQATFLVLARKAPSVRPRQMVGNWLYGVAYRTALEARGASARRKAKEREVVKPEAVPEDTPRDWQPLLDRELHRLPAKYRVPIVLCDLEGKTRREVARQLGWPEGTVSVRLARGRVLLAERLSRRGLTLAGGAVAWAVSGQAAPGCVPTRLMLSTIKAATSVAVGQAVAPGMISGNVAALTEGVLKAMLLTKLKVATGVLLAVGAVAMAAGALGHRGPAQAPAAARPPVVAVHGQGQAAPPPARDEMQARKDRACSMTGVVVAVDAPRRQVTMIVPTNDVMTPFVELTRQLATGAKVLVSDGGKEKEGKLADLARDTVVDYLFAHEEDPQVVLEIRVRPKK